MSKHTITAELAVSFPGTDPSKTETAHPEVEIEFNFIPGCPETGPSYASGGEPATGPEIEALSVKVINGDGIGMSDRQWLDRAQDWLDGDGYDRAVAEVEADDERSAAYFREYEREE